MAEQPTKGPYDRAPLTPDGQPPAPPAPALSPPPAWLGSGRFWALASVLFVLSFVVLAVRAARTSREGALVPVLSLSGPSQATRGETSRFAVLVRDARGASVPNAPVRVGFWKTSLLELGHATTGPGGDATVDVRFPDDFKEPRNVVAVTDVGVVDALDGLLVTPKTPGRGSVFISTDKPMAQPGQTIHIRALAMAGTTPIADRPALIEIRTEDGIKVFREERRTSAFGVVATDFALADQVKLGRYDIAVRMTLADGQTAAGSRGVDVKRYTLPKLKVALEDVTPLTVEGLRGKARATWIFGEPVVKAQVNVELEGWTGGAKTATGVTDKDGTFTFDLRPHDGLKPSPLQRGSFPLKAKVVVEGGMSAEATASVSTIRGGEITLEAFPESGALVHGVAQDVFVVVTGRDPSEGVTLDVEDSRAVKMSERGIARVRVLANAPLPYDGAPPPPVTILAHGDKGSEGRLVLEPLAEGLVVRPAEDTFAAGTLARVTVLGAERGDHVALRMTKGAEPIALGSCVVEDVKAGCDVMLPTPKDLSGLAWLHAMSLPLARREVPKAELPTRRGQVLSGKRLVVVGAGARDLALKITPDRAFYAPRDQGSLDVAVTGAGGAPVQAQLGVAVADEAVFALAEVRPDLEKIFFTIDKDLELTRRQYSYSSWRGRRDYGSSERTTTEKALPRSLEASAAYDPSTERDVRSTILAALTTMPEAGAPGVRTSSESSSRAVATASEERQRLRAWAVVVMAFYTLAAFAGLGLYAWSRRGAAAGPFSDEDLAAFRLETRGLYIDWLIAALGPPGLTFAIILTSDLVSSGSFRGEGGLACWLVLGLFCAVLLVRAVLRIRRTAVAKTEHALVRGLVFLPVAAFLAHLTIVMFVVEKRNGLDDLFGRREDAFILLLLVVGAAQLACGALSLIRQSHLRTITPKGRAWLVLSRASFLGLPITLALVGFLLVMVVRRGPTGWTGYAESEMERDESSQSADNKEGGTGTRAKGEEGSMGNPQASRSSAMPAASAFAVTGASGGKAEPPRVRDFFPETLLWAPELITDEAGHAKVVVPFADSITTWRFGVRAVSKAGQLGSAALPLVVKQDFFVDMSLPPVLTQSDELAMPVTVYSYLPEEQDVVLEVEGAGMSTVGPSKTVLHLAPREARGFRFVVRADKAGDRVVRLRATGKTRADALERKVRVVPNGLSVLRTSNAHFIGAGRASVEFPAAAIDGGDDLFVKVYGGPLSQVAEGLDGVFMMPHGCFEQTSSTTYPSVLALQFLERSKAASPEIEKKARRAIADGYQRLVAFEVSGGGFSLFGASPASTTMTAYGLLEFSDMARVSPVDEALLTRTREWLYRARSATGGWLKPPSYDDKPSVVRSDDALVTAYVAWAIAASEQPGVKDPKLAGVLDTVARMAGPEAEEAYALTLRANALLAGGRAAEARPLLDRLAAKMLRDDEGVHWTSKATGVMYSYGASMDVEVTGLAAHALALAGLEPEARAGATSWLAARRTSWGTWSTTQATIAAMRALLDEAKPAPKEPQELTVLVDGEQADAFRLEPGARDVHRLISLRRWATTGKHAVELRASGGSDVAFQLVDQHYLPWQKAPPGKASPLVLDVAYAPSPVAAGSVTSCQVRLAWHGKEAARMPLVEIGIPPAFEVETAGLDKLVADREGRVKRYTVERGKVTLYLIDLPEDKPLSVDLPLRALRPARVVVPASTAYLYYEPEVRSETVPVVMRAL